METSMAMEVRERIYEIYKAYAEGQFELLLDSVIDDEIEFVSNAPSHAFPYFGRNKGKVALLAAWKASRADYEFLSYLPLLIVAEGDDAAAIVVTMRVRAKATDRVMSLTVADFLRFRGGLVVEFRQFMDSFDATEQWLGKEIDVSMLKAASMVQH
jgi:ketosteroid isomerase-like protein